MFASNFPVDGLCATFGTIFGGFRQIVADLSAAEQKALFRDNAMRIYAFPETHGSAAELGDHPAGVRA
jgi:predicted TIM-barrel fold metal-dependent hydrolase